MRGHDAREAVAWPWDGFRGALGRPWRRGNLDGAIAAGEGAGGDEVGEGGIAPQRLEGGFGAGPHPVEGRLEGDGPSEGGSDALGPLTAAGVEPRLFEPEFPLLGGTEKLGA